MWPSEANPVYGGFVALQAEALASCGASVQVVANDDPRTGVLSSLGKYRRLTRRVRRAVRHGEFDVVIGHYLYPTAGMARMAARIAGAKLVLVVHGTDARSVLRPDPYARAARRAARSANLVVAVSQALARSLRADLRISESVPMTAIHMGIDEASACHLTYIWSELRMLGQDPRLWFSTMRQDRGKKKPKAEEAAERRQVLDGRQRPDVAFQVRLQVGTEPQRRRPGPRQHLRDDAARQCAQLILRRFFPADAIRDHLS